MTRTQQTVITSLKIYSSAIDIENHINWHNQKKKKVGKMKTYIKRYFKINTVLEKFKIENGINQGKKSSG